MKIYTWESGEISGGVAVRDDERFGPVVFFGEEGRGRRYEKISLDKFNSPEINDRKIFEAFAKKIFLPEKDGKPEKTFYILSKSQNIENEKILVRIYTLTSYVRGASGRFKTVEGSPETLVSGYGAFGDAGGVGSWDDALVIMKPGDVIRVYPSRGDHSYALWIGRNGKPVTATWTEYENIRAVEIAGEQEPELVFGSMEVFTFRGGEIKKGLKIEKGSIGPSVTLGEPGRGRTLAEISLVGMETPKIPCPKRGNTHWWWGTEPPQKNDIKECSECGATYKVIKNGDRIEFLHPEEGEINGLLEKAAIVKLDEKEIPSRYGGEPTKKIIYGLTASDKIEKNGFLIRISTSGPYTKNTSGTIKTWKGEPFTVLSGSGAHGDAGRIGGWEDSLVVIHEGDVLLVRQEGGHKSSGPWAVFVRNGQILAEPWQEWKRKDSQLDPNFYFAKEMAPENFFPSDWIGRIVTTYYYEWSENKLYLREGKTGELTRIEDSAVTLNLGWEGLDYHEECVNCSWVYLEKDKRVVKPSEQEAEERKQFRTQAEELRCKAAEICRLSFFSFAGDYLQEQLRKIAQEDGFDLMITQREYFKTSLVSWIESTKKVLEEFEKTIPEIKDLENRQNEGKILCGFEAHHRHGGMTGCGDGWVIRPDGSLRSRDSDNVKRHKSDGTYYWNRVEPEELALRWYCGTQRDISGSSTFDIAKLPTSGCTPQQLEAVAKIEKEICAPANSFGLNAEIRVLFDRRIEGIKRVCRKSRIIKVVSDELDYLVISGDYGMIVDPKFINGRIECFIDRDGEFTEDCENRGAQMIESQPAGDGILEFLAYEKWGQMNLNIRWRELREGESAGEEDSLDEGKNGGSEDNKNIISQLANIWGATIKTKNKI